MIKKFHCTIHSFCIFELKDIFGVLNISFNFEFFNAMRQMCKLHRFSEAECCFLGKIIYSMVQIDAACIGIFFNVRKIR